MPFSKNDLSLCIEKFGQFSEDPAKLTEEFAKLTLTFNFTWGNLQILLSCCCTAEEKAKILSAAWQYANDVAACNWGHTINHTREETISDGDNQ